MGIHDNKPDARHTTADLEITNVRPRGEKTGAVRYRFTVTVKEHSGGTHNVTFGTNRQELYEEWCDRIYCACFKAANHDALLVLADQCGRFAESLLCPSERQGARTLQFTTGMLRELREEFPRGLEDVRVRVAQIDAKRKEKSSFFGFGGDGLSAEESKWARLCEIVIKVPRLRVTSGRVERQEWEPVNELTMEFFPEAASLLLEFCDVLAVSHVAHVKRLVLMHSRADLRQFVLGGARLEVLEVKGTPECYMTGRRGHREVETTEDGREPLVFDFAQVPENSKGLQELRIERALGDNDLRELLQPPRGLPEPPFGSLKRLVLTNNLLRRLPPALEHCHSVERLELDGNQIERLEHLPRGLGWLSAPKNCIVDCDEGVRLCPSLVYIDLSDNSIESFPWAVHEHLEILNLAQNSLGDLNWRGLRNVSDVCPKLAFLSLHGNLLTPEGRVRELLEVLFCDHQANLLIDGTTAKKPSDKQIRKLVDAYPQVLKSSPAPPPPPRVVDPSPHTRQQPDPLPQVQVPSPGRRVPPSPRPAQASSEQLLTTDHVHRLHKRHSSTLSPSPVPSPSSHSHQSRSSPHSGPSPQAQRHHHPHHHRSPPRERGDTAIDRTLSRTAPVLRTDSPEKERATPPPPRNAASVRIPHLNLGSPPGQQLEEKLAAADAVLASGGLGHSARPLTRETRESESSEFVLLLKKEPQDGLNMRFFEYGSSRMVVLHAVQPGSAAAKAGADRFINHQLLTIDYVDVECADDLGNLTRHLREVRLEFSPMELDGVESPRAQKQPDPPQYAHPPTPPPEGVRDFLLDKVAGASNAVLDAANTFLEAKTERGPACCRTLNEWVRWYCGRIQGIRKRRYRPELQIILLVLCHMHVFIIVPMVSTFISLSCGEECNKEDGANEKYRVFIVSMVCLATLYQSWFGIAALIMENAILLVFFNLLTFVLAGRYIFSLSYYGGSEEWKVIVPVVVELIFLVIFLVISCLIYPQFPVLVMFRVGLSAPEQKAYKLVQLFSALSRVDHLFLALSAIVVGFWYLSEWGGAWEWIPFAGVCFISVILYPLAIRWNVHEKRRQMVLFFVFTLLTFGGQCYLGYLVFWERGDELVHLHYAYDVTAMTVGASIVFRLALFLVLALNVRSYGHGLAERIAEEAKEEKVWSI
eukprot:Hpha_TRINITY_DN15390_c1_g2::TRINITY_DN15390_c1_g2_i1::g.92057::m.92057